LIAQTKLKQQQKQQLEKPKDMQMISQSLQKVLTSVMQTILFNLQRWCERHDPSVNPTKTEMVLFTRKRKLKNLRAPRLFGKELSLSY